MSLVITAFCHCQVWGNHVVRLLLAGSKRFGEHDQARWILETGHSMMNATNVMNMMNIMNMMNYSNWMIYGYIRWW